VWDAAGLNLLGTAVHAHEDRIMGIALHRNEPYAQTETAPYIMATASIDLTAKLWTVKYNSNSSEEEEGEKAEIVEVAHWKGHAARLAKVAIHPTGRYVGTTSFDTTWRLWDVERGSSSVGGETNETELLLQDGHDKAVFGIDFHPDGSLCATSDFGGVVRLWDLRTSKSIHVMTGTHAGRVLCTQFAKPWGFQLATAGDDGTIQIWDLRKHGKQLASLPAHSRLVTQLEYCPNGETLLSSSFDGTAKVWSTRADYKLLNTFRGHEGKVLGVASLMNGGSIATCGYDKTLKLWQ
jgi:U4/U6 small nuclear ribonucleoprotein PRP4